MNDNYIITCWGYKEMSVLKIHLSYQCSAHCAHCHLRAGRGSAPAIDFDLAMTTVSALQKHNDLDYVVLLGGEPGLFPELTHKLATAIHRSELGVRVETNASWATDEEAATSFLKPLCEVDAQIMLSVDAFHEPFVSLACVEQAIRTLDTLGGKYVIEVPYIDFPAAQHSFDIRTNELLSELEERLSRKPCAPLCKGPVFFKGRAAHALAPLVADGKGVPNDVCDTVPWWSNGAQSTLELLGLDPEGYLTKECGIVIGNVKQQSVEQIIRSFDANMHPIISTLIRKGPLGLAHEAAEMGYTIKSSYADKCHLCQETREVLRAKYPDLLAPEIHYEENEIPNKSDARDGLQPRVIRNVLNDMY